MIHVNPLTTEEELRAEMIRWVCGELDEFDHIIRAVKRKIVAPHVLWSKQEPPKVGGRTLDIIECYFARDPEPGTLSVGIVVQ